MTTMKNVLQVFIRGITRSRVSYIGALIVTAIFPFLLGMVILDSMGIVDNPYFGAVLYMGLGPLFVIGLAMVIIGLFFLRGRHDVGLFTHEYLLEQLSDSVRFQRVQKLVLFGVILTGLNLFVIGLISYSGYHYMESNAFCGKFCHSVMEPEYTAYQRSPHSRVKCVECHIGPGAGWFVKSKLSGARQLVAVVAKTYSRPIETPVHGLRPARDTCEQCHRPEKFHGEQMVVRERFQPDEANTLTKTVLMMKIGSAGDRTISPHGIHWHVAPQNRITYRTADRSRNQIPEVTLHRPDGSKLVYRTDDADALLAAGPVEERDMDCIDCHNRPTHIYLGPDDALDERILKGEITRDLPFIKQQALATVEPEYATREEGLLAIETHLRNWYRDNQPELVQSQAALIEQAIRGVQAAWSDYVWPRMNIQWNTYTSHLGHTNDLGCFRCHAGDHTSDSGETIDADCATCHTILAMEEEDPAILQSLKGE